MGIKRLNPFGKSKKLSSIFIKYLIELCIMTFFLIFALAASTSTLTESPPSSDTVEKQLSENRVKIESADKVTADLIPDKCNYAVYSSNGKIISGNISKSSAEKAWNLLRKSDKDSDSSYYYIKVRRKNGECIIRYPLSRQFISPVLREKLPTPDSMFFIILFFGFLLEIIVFALIFQKKFDSEMRKLKNATEKIQNQDLNFSIEHSSIYEINSILQSMDKMKEALKSSLKKQWDMEDMRRRQISALAHDVKTPITIVRGNAELLLETDQTDEQKEYTNYIKDSTSEMEQYIKSLIEISKAEIGYDIKLQNVDCRKYMDEIHACLSALAAAKNLILNFNIKNIPENFKADPGLLKRAVMNVASNAADYSSVNGFMDFIVEAKDGFIMFCITDSGKGFSNEALKNAAEEFYMGDSSRSSRSHYGMGLYIAKSIANLHGGRLSISNSAATGGGCVVIEIPII